MEVISCVSYDTIATEASSTEVKQASTKYAPLNLFILELLLKIKGASGGF